MSIFGKLRGLAGKPEATAEPAPPADPVTAAMAELDAVIDQLERVRADAAKVLTAATAGDRTALVASMRTLDAKLDEARRKRKDLASRIDRTATRRALTAELTALREELEGLDDAGRAGPRGVAIRDRFAEIKIEIAALVAASRES
jgi:chromosome segregation ATPase